MTLQGWLFNILCRWAMRITRRRPPDFVVGHPLTPYLRRWWVIPRNKLFNVYVHEFLRSDDDRALHDHPWPWASLLLSGRYIEHTIAAGGIHRLRAYWRGCFRMHGPRFAHRLEIVPGQPCYTLFITGPRVREWGFHCRRGWVHWQKFTDPKTGGTTVGRGCDQ